jgi:hypothetical protein
LKNAVFGSASCTCGNCPICKGTKGIQIPTVNAGEFLIHVPILQRLTEKIVTWFLTENEGPFITDPQWKAVLSDTFASQLEAKLFKMYLKNGRNNSKHTSWLWSCTDKNKKLIKISKDPIDNLDWTFYNLRKLIAEFERLLAYLQVRKAPSFSRQEELRSNLIALTQSFISDQVMPKFDAIRTGADGSRLSAFT